MLERTILWLACVLIAAPAAAHPGHGEPGQGFTLVHYLTEPIHVLAFVVVAVLGAAAWRMAQGRPGRERRRP
jgi:hydrogenase/urease accessory protein HupE